MRKWEPKGQLGTLLFARRHGWNFLPDTQIFFRMTPDGETNICELVPFMHPLPDSNKRHIYINWWAESEEALREIYDPSNPPAFAQRLMDGFYVYHDLAPITQYTAFRLWSTSGKPVDGSFTHEFVELPVAVRTRSGQAKPAPVDRPMKLRFKILTRDGYRCRYCGRTAEQTELQIDHVIPRSKGGPTTEENLITSCRACNIGKGDVLLEASATPPTKEPALAH